METTFGSSTPNNTQGDYFRFPPEVLQQIYNLALKIDRCRRLGITLPPEVTEFLRPQSPPTTQDGKPKWLIRDLMQMASLDMLDDAYRRGLEAVLDSNPTLIMEAKLDQDVFWNLVKKVPLLGIKAISQILDCDKATGKNLLSILLKKPLITRSVEVIKWLILTLKFPKEMILLFLLRCMSTADKTPDEYKRTKMAMLICVLAQIFLDGKVVTREQMGNRVAVFYKNHGINKEMLAVYVLLSGIDQKKTRSYEVYAARILLDLVCLLPNSEHDAQ